MTENIHSKYERVTSGRKLLDRVRLEARISQLEADKAALMEVARTIERSYWDHDEWCSEVRRSVLFLPDHLRKAAMEADTEEAR